MERLAKAEEAGEEGVRATAWINRDKRLPARAGDYLAPHKFDPVFTDWLGDDAIPHLQQLIEGGEEHGVRHCRFQMLAGGDGQPYKQKWHRDQQFTDPEGSLGETCIDACKATNGLCVEWNTPLQPDDHYLHIVPGSHCRANTDAEEACLRSEDVHAPMAGAVVVEMQPGDVCYFDAGMLHRGWNPEGNLRWTLHHVTWCSTMPVMMDYELVDSAPDLQQVLSTHPSMHPGGRKYITDFLELLEEEEVKALRNERQTSIYDIWLPVEEADAMREARAKHWRGETPSMRSRASKL
jgi:hypothetical protein